MLSDNTIAHITIALQVGDQGVEQTGVAIWAANDLQEFIHSLGTDKCVQQREGNGEGQFHGFRF